jgi:filamentous hemagglutinin family protein
VLLNLVHAEVVTDGSVGTRLSVQGPEFVIPQSLGSTVGTNLFHSFQSFNIANTQSATFTGANSTSNVISRVTGRQSSTIDGVLRSEVGRANFYFINPAGIVFGPNASINVPAAFHASTAANLQFSDGALFNAVNPAVSTLSMANPSAFGFVENRSAGIRIKQSQLKFTPDSVTSLSAGEIVIENGSLFNEGGEIHITAVGALDSQVLIASGFNESVSGTGNILVDGSFINATGNGAGQIVISGGKTEIVDSFVFSGNTGNDAPNADAGVMVDVNSLLLDSAAIASAPRTRDAGMVDISVADTLNIVNGGNIGNDTRPGSNGNAGTVSVQANNIIIDGRGSASFTGIGSDAVSQSGGNAGNITVSASDTLNIVNGGMIRSDTMSVGNAGSVTLLAKNININGQGSEPFTGIRSDAVSESSGNTGNITVSTSGNLNIVNGGAIRSDFSSSSSDQPGRISVTANDTLNIANDGLISTITFSDNNAGSVNVIATNLNINGLDSQFFTGIGSEASRGSGGKAGSVSATVSGNLRITNDGIISSRTFSNKDAGSVNIAVTDTLNIATGGSIRSSTFSIGKAGSVNVKTTNLNIDRQDSQFVTGILSDTTTKSVGDAGQVNIQVTDTANIVNGGTITTSTVSTGDAGATAITVGNSLNIVNGGSITSSTFAAGNAGSVTVSAKDININAINSQSFTGIASDVNRGATASDANQGATDKGGSISVSASGSLNIVNNSIISSSTFANRNAGSIAISVADTLNLANGGIISSSTLSSGDAGSIAVQATTLNINGQDSQSSTGIRSDAKSGSNGDAGSITIQATNLDINGLNSQFRSGISSEAEPNSGGDAGQIKVTVAETLNVKNVGSITSNTFAQGKAGTLTLEATSLVLDRGFIFSAAIDGSSGQPGNISINTKNLFSRNGSTINIQSLPFIDIKDFSKIVPTEINIQAETITLDSNANITTQSLGNVPASNIIINAKNQLNTHDTQIITAANQANGGDITINGGNIFLTNSQVTTSVAGEGNGGNITLNPKVLVLNTGFVQANTAGANATGGNINIDSEAMISSNNQLVTGGNTPVAFQPSFNVIQAAAPDGVSGNIAIISPELNISGTLASLDAQLIDIDSLSKTPCATPTLKQSILTSISKGGLPTSVAHSLSVPLNSLRLQKMLDQSVPDQLNTISPQARNFFANTPCF